MIAQARFGRIKGSWGATVIYDFRLPKINPFMTSARLECLHATVGSALKPGDKFLDLSVDLSSAFSQDCPPISFFRVIIRERAFLRAFEGEPGDTVEISDRLALLTSEPDEPTEGDVIRPVRFATAGIVRHPQMWSGSFL